jgi:hypothetical protein
MQTLKDTYRRSRWVMPAFALVLGAVFMAAQWIGGDATGGRSGAIAIMRRPARDERARNIDLAATAFAGIVLITVILVAVMVQFARGEDPSPYAQLGAVGGVAYLVALVGMQRRG